MSTSERKSPARHGSRNGADNLNRTDRLADSNERFNQKISGEIDHAAADPIVGPARTRKSAETQRVLSLLDGLDGKDGAR